MNSSTDVSGIRNDFSPWDLPAPESQVLLTGWKTPNNWAVKLALKELVLKQRLAVTSAKTRRFLILPTQVKILIDGKQPNAALTRTEAAMMSVFPRPTYYGQRTRGVPVGKAAMDVMRWYRAAGGFVVAEILPELERRGLYTQERQNGQLVWTMTELGVTQLTRLREILQEGREVLPELLPSDADRAREYFLLAGPAALLIGNPQPWMWTLLSETLANTSDVDYGQGDPIGGAPSDEFRKQQDAAGGGFWLGAPGDADPQKVIDQEVDDALDDSGDGSDGDGE